MKGFAFAAVVALGLGSPALAQEPGATTQGTRGFESAPVETGQRPEMGEVQELENRQREQYEALEEEVLWKEGTGGSGKPTPGTSPAAFDACAKALGEAEPVTLVTGEVQKVSKNDVIVEDAYGRSVRLRANAETCAMRAGQPIDLKEIREGTAIRASYDIEDERMTARVVRIIEDEAREPSPRTLPQQQQKQ